MDKRTFKDTVYAELSRIPQALANSKRLEIIDLLAQGERTVEKIAMETSTSVANASKHLQVLKSASLAEIRREGNFIFYKIKDARILQAWKLMRDFGTDQINEVQKVVKDFREKKNTMESVTIDELLKKLNVSNIILLDIRPEEEYRAGHIPKAISMPIEQLASRLKDVPKNKQVIAYCRGQFCVFADEAVQFLLKNKVKAVRLDEGFPEWKLKGLPVEMN
jgi:rhodanese-related sulfurtransferase